MYFKKLKITVFVLILFQAYGCVEGEQEQKVFMQSPEEVENEKTSLPDDFDAEFKDGMVGTVFQNYLEIRTSLVHSDFKNAQRAAKNMRESFGDERENIKEIISRMIDAKDIDEFRTYFSTLTEEIEPLLSKSIKSGKVYKQYCPMAFDNKGGYWFSDSKEILNPYFGEDMLHCGSVSKTIK